MVVAYAVALIVYLTLEPALISGLPAPAYWVVRLLPDGLVAALAMAVVVWGDRTARSVPVRLLWGLAGVCLVLVAANLARGESVIDSVNAIRVVVRHLALGLLVWWAVGSQASIGPLILRAVLIAGLIQVVIAAAQIVARAVSLIGSATPFDPVHLMFIDGTLGRYDRLGLLLMSVAIAVVASRERMSRNRVGVLAACMVLLYLTTSRQAMVGLMVAGAVLAVFPRVELQRRAAGLALAGLSVLFVLGTPGQLPPVPSDDPDAVGPGPAASVRPGLPRPNPGSKGSTQLSLDPNRNFRLYYNLQLAPWAAITEPLVGFGPREQESEQPDPRLRAQVESAGMDWSWARRFMNDSNYASLIIQFGIIAPVLFLLLLLVATGRAAVAATRDGGGFARFAAINAVAVLVAAFFGPAFEIRMVSIILWISLLAALATLQRSSARA
jgi:hypothetical protein